MESESIESRLNAKNPDVIQLFSAATANGVKVAAALEEIAAERQCDNFYEAHTVRIRASENYAPFFLKLNPTGKIPVIVDSHAKETGPVEEREVTLFESGAILMYLAERYDVLLPKDFNLRYKTIEWLFWGSSEFSAQVNLEEGVIGYFPMLVVSCFIWSGALEDSSGVLLSYSLVSLA